MTPEGGVAGAHGVPDWVRREQRPFPDANLLLLHGRVPALVDPGFVGHADGAPGPGACP